MDDMLIHTKKDVQLHRRLVHRVLDKLRRHDLFLKPEKCLFEQSTMEFLGVVLENGTIRMDPTKIKGVADWPLPQTVKDVRAFLGFTGFYRYFVPNYSMIARPLIELTKKAVPFHWETPQRKAFETLKTLMCRRPILRQPEYKKPFFLATDASAYGVGAVLSQEGELHPRTKKPIQHPIAYYSATFTPTERNYDIYERELLAILKALEHWRPHLAATEIPVTILTDHANLTFWKNPRKVNRRVARWFATLQDYNLLIKHVPGKLHAAPDMLSRPPGTDKGKLDNQDVTLLPPDSFIRLTLEEDQEIIDLERSIVTAQKKHPKLLEHWRRTKQVSDRRASYTNELTACKNNLQAAIPPEDSLKREILRIYHDSIAAGHPGRDQTYENVVKWHWWPGMRDWIAQYVKGCGPCQQNKILTHRTKIPLYRINIPSEAQPFQVIAMDLITQLPKCDGFDAILTIVDHGCSRAAVFIPCHTTITGEGIAKLYFEHIYKWFGLPDRMISNRDPRFTSYFAKALCTQLGIKQNISTAFHPQTDGLSERKNQWVEQFLRFLTMHQQDDWAQWLPIATAVHNNAVNASTKVAPTEALLGYLPRLDYRSPSTSLNPRVETRKEMAIQKREQAKAALNRLADLVPKDQYQVNEKVWLDAKNLSLPYQTLKLAPRRHGPFTILQRVSPVAYKLKLPPTWTIHDIFHASLLTPYRETSQHGDNFTRPPPDLVDNLEEFEVEEVINHRHFGKGRQLQYLIKWKGYPTADNTWESADQVFAPELIRKYHMRHPLEGYKPTTKRRKVNIRSLQCLLPQSTSTTPPAKSSSSPTSNPTPHPPPMTRLKTAKCFDPRLISRCPPKSWKWPRPPSLIQRAPSPSSTIGKTSSPPKPLLPWPRTSLALLSTSCSTPPTAKIDTESSSPPFEGSETMFKAASTEPCRRPRQLGIVDLRKLSSLRKPNTALTWKQSELVAEPPSKTSRNAFVHTRMLTPSSAQRDLRRIAGKYPTSPSLSTGSPCKPATSSTSIKAALWGPPEDPTTLSSSKICMPPPASTTTTSPNPFRPGSSPTSRLIPTRTPLSLRSFSKVKTGESTLTSSDITAATPISAPSKKRSPLSRLNPKPYARNLGVRVSAWRMQTSPVASVTCKPSLLPPPVVAAMATTPPPSPSAISGLAPSPTVGLQSNRRVMTPAVSSGHRVVDGYVRVGPNRWSRRSDVSGV